MGKNKIPCGGFVLGDSLTLGEENRLGVNWEKQTQSDWNQNDENAPDYVKNRLCYEGIGIVNISWNGYIGGRIGQAYNPSEAFWKMSDNIYAKEELIGQSFTFYDGMYQRFTTVEITEERINDTITSWLDGVKGFIISSADGSPKIAIITEVTSSATLTPGLYFSGSTASNSQNLYSHDYVSNMTTNGVVVHQLDPKYVPGTSVLVRIDYKNGNYVADKPFDDIMTAIEDGKYVCAYYVDEDEYYQLTDKLTSSLSFSRATPFGIKQLVIRDSNKIDYRESDLDGSKNWLLSFDEKGRTTPVESLDYIKLKSPNGTLYTISVTDNGTIQANAGS